MPYNRALDGLRAVAVILVILFHGHYLACGWVGVQWFFVLSGFLITGILVDQKSRLPLGRFLGRFFWRRTLRIWPLYFLYFGIFAVLYVVLRQPEAFRSQWTWLATFTYNFHKAWSVRDEPAYFGHLWSLCIEEQFYLVWPFLVFALSLSAMRRLTLLLVLAGPLLRGAAKLYFQGLNADPDYVGDAVYVFTASQVDAFAAGACVALLPAALRERWAPRAGFIAKGAMGLTLLAGLASLAYLRPLHLASLSSLGYQACLIHLGQSLWGYSLINLAGAAWIFALTVSPASSLWLNSRIAVYIGRISFGVYVWHAPLQDLAERLMPVPNTSILGLLRAGIHLLATLLVATGSYYGFERYFLKLKAMYPTRRFLAQKTDAPSTGITLG